MALRPLLLLLAALQLPISSLAAFVAIDYGSDWTKVSLMSSGRKMDVLLNTDSKRKFQSAVGWKKDERSFSTDAVNLAARFPSDSFPSLKYLVGAKYGGSQSSYYTQITEAVVVENAERHTCSLRRPDGTIWTTEELIAMQFANIKDIAEREAGESVTEAVVTVPPFYTQFERQSVLDALAIAGLRPIALINDGMAVAVNYAMARDFKTPERHIIYDAGASSITATVVSFTSQPPPNNGGKVLKSSVKNVTDVEVISFGFDTVASGTELDRRLQRTLVEKFEKQHDLSIVNHQRALVRLWKEAGRVKGVLSANTESPIRVESLANDIDFKDSIKRSEFEALAADLIPRFTQPISDALTLAKLSLSDIDSVILTGGASRIPMVRAAVSKLVGDKMATNVNADEAAVLGAAFYGATTKTSFRTKPITFQDIGAYDVSLTYGKEGTSKTIVSQVLSGRSKVGQRHTKKLAFPKRTVDFTVTLAYKNTGSIDFPQEIFEATFEGVGSAIKNLTAEGVALPIVKATLGLTDSGMIFVKEAVAQGELPKVEEPKPTPSAEEVKADANSTETTAAKNETVAAPKILSHDLTTKIKFLSIPPLTEAQKVDSIAKLSAIREQERTKVLREEAVNNLEGYLYRLRDLLDDTVTAPSSFKEFVQESELKKLQDGLIEGLRWMHNDIDAADTATIWKKRNDIEAVELPVIQRYKEASTGPKALEDLQKAHALGRAFLTEAKLNQTIALESGATPRFTEEDLKNVEEVLDESENWLRDLSEKQRKLSKKDNPVLLTAEMESHGMKVQRTVKTLEKRKPWRPAKPPQTSTSSTTSATETTSTTASETATSSQSEPTSTSTERDRQEL